MSIADTIITLVVLLYQNTILTILPTQISFYPLSTFDSAFTNMATYLTSAYNGISFFFPINLILGLFLTVITAELSLVSFRAVKYLIATFRGSGT